MAPDGPYSPQGDPAEPVGLIAGDSQLPLLVADGIRAAGRPVYAIGLANQYLPELADHCDRFEAVGVARIGRWIRVLRRWGVREAVMVGGVAHDRKYAKWQLLRYAPDWRAFWLWYRSLRHDRRTGALLTALADELDRSGVRLIDNRAFIPEHLASPGVMGRTTPSTDLDHDIQFGWPLLSEATRLGVGQSLAVRNRDVIAVEAAEGTDAMIERAGRLCQARPWALLKTCAASHDMRADVATVGLQTLERLHQAGGRALALGVGRVIMVDKPAMVEFADRLGIALVGVDADSGTA
ncbi:MAG: LpxI family protein [Phycisphaerales bacterium]